MVDNSNMQSPEERVRTKRTLRELYLKYYAGYEQKRQKFGVTVANRKNGRKKIYLYPLYLTLRGQKRTDEEILVEFKKVSPEYSDKYLLDKIKFFHSKKAV